MLDLNWMCENADVVRAALGTRHDSTAGLDRLIALNDERKTLQHSFDEGRRQIKELSGKFPEVAKAGGDVKALKEQVRELKESNKAAEKRLAEVQREIRDIQLTIPNLPHDAAPVGGEEANRETKVWGDVVEHGFPAGDHIAIGEGLGILDVQDRGVKISGSGFAMFKGQGARLVRGLLNFMLELHTEEHGYTEVWPPYLVNEDTMRGTGQLPKFRDDMYCCEADNMFLIPTAEVPVTNLLRDEILGPDALPIAYTAWTPCFRREAGSYGADTRGLMRLHQFDKVELVRFCKAEDSEAEHEKLLGHAETVLQKLGLRYRVLELATADMGFAAARCFDLEAWAPVTKRWFEVSSVSNFRDFQARRANIRRRVAEKSVEFVHTLNGSGLALPRVILCLLEQYQQEDGSVRLPEALVPFVGREVLTREG